jgi:SAM-dependent methyltransferase
VLSLRELSDRQLLTCPVCRSTVVVEDGRWRCATADCRCGAFPVVAGMPALVDFDHSVLTPDALQVIGAAPQSRPLRAGRVGWLSPLSNQTARLQVRRMSSALRVEGHGARPPRVLVVGGGTIGYGLDELYADPNLELLAFDIYASPFTQFIADAHAIPLADASVDAVIVQAVLEHVLAPQTVVDEIGRVLRPRGLVYADTPFMQQVHAGAHDFTRFTDSGHRYLFRSFERIDSGAVGGAGTALRWSVEYFVRALTRSRMLGKVFSAGLGWLGFLDRFLDERHSLDACSSVFFLGRKSDQLVPPAGIVDYYQGGDSTRLRKE